MVSLMERRRELMVQSLIVPTYTIDDYVQDDLRFWLDGIKNTSTGHNASATKWIDLSGNGQDYTYKSATVIGDKYCIPNASMTSSTDRPNTAPGTIEIVLEHVDGEEAGQMIMPWYGNNWGTVWLTDTYQRIYFSSGNNSGSIGVALQSGVHTYVARSLNEHYIDGQLETSIAANASWSSSYKHQLFYYNSSYKRTCVSKIYAIRVHNRTLTVDEIVKNAAVDHARFS